MNTIVNQELNGDYFVKVEHKFSVFLFEDQIMIYSYIQMR